MPSAIEGIVIAATSEVALPVIAEGSEEGLIAVGILGAQMPARVANANVAVGEGLVNDVEPTNEAVVGELEDCPFWVLLIRANYVLW